MKGLSRIIILAIIAIMFVGLLLYNVATKSDTNDMFLLILSVVSLGNLLNEIIKVKKNGNLKEKTVEFDERAKLHTYKAGYYSLITCVVGMIFIYFIGYFFGLPLPLYGMLTILILACYCLSIILKFLFIYKH